MTEIDRRSAMLMTLLGAAGAGPAASAQTHTGGGTTPQHDMSMVPPAPTGVEHIAMLVYPRMTALDLIGPQYMFSVMMGTRVHLVGKSLDPVTSDTGVTITPTATFETCPKDVAVLFTPGGTDGTFAAMEDAATRSFMADRGARAKYVTSVCTGSLILAASGLLTGYKATSHWAARDSLAEFGAIPTDARVVRDRNRITGAGVTAGLDFGLTMVAEMRGDTYAQMAQLLCEYDPHPPFNAGSTHTAPPQVLAGLQKMLGRIPGRIHGIAQALKA